MASKSWRFTYRPVQDHEEQLGLIEVQMAVAPRDYLVVAFIPGDFPSILLCERFGLRHAAGCSPQGTRSLTLSFWANAYFDGCGVH